MQLPLIRKMNQALRGQPDRWLTLLLVAIAVASLLVAFKAPPVVKAAWLAWEIAP